MTGKGMRRYTTQGSVEGCWEAGRFLCLGPLAHVSQNLVSEGEKSNPNAAPLLFGPK